MSRDCLAASAHCVVVRDQNKVVAWMSPSEFAEEVLTRIARSVSSSSATDPHTLARLSIGLCPCCWQGALLMWVHLPGHLWSAMCLRPCCPANQIAARLPAVVSRVVVWCHIVALRPVRWPSRWNSQSRWTLPISALMLAMSVRLSGLAGASVLSLSVTTGLLDVVGEVFVPARLSMPVGSDALLLLFSNICLQFIDVPCRGCSSPRLFFECLYLAGGNRGRNRGEMVGTGGKGKGTKREGRKRAKWVKKRNESGDRKAGER
ncbi:hypothetical protein Tco_0128627 [Tanacetum coccineum]